MPERPSGSSLHETPATSPGLIADSSVAAGVDALTAGTVGVTDAGAPEGRSRRRLGLGFWIAAAWIVALVLAAVLAEHLHLPGPNEQLAGDPRSGPSLHHVLGTDELGYDLFSRVIHGARVSLEVGVFAILFGLVVGGTIGLIAGFYQGRTERVLMWAMDVMLAFPALILALAFVTFLGQSKPKTYHIVLAIGILSIPAFARIARASTLNYAQREFVQAARMLGARNSRIMVREVLPNVALPLVSFAVIAMAVAIVGEATLSFLGLGVPEISWGSMIAQGKGDLETSPQAALMPAAAMFFTVMALNFIGDRLRSRADLKEVSV